MHLWPMYLNQNHNHKINGNSVISQCWINMCAIVLLMLQQ